ncbi:PepSY domain-containing protein [Galbibacter sp. EGI 63066]|uniref:PepSY domain-containing protein n=1 Tax=Galbibacter sp. EGI 63066 TaxID=2993559 RepID=UPI0022499A78|nr:PepSY domain-containing protein [Galbibacter sp. EGI 63066]MCX2681857.1 PepSY domain-containing protein [Galbibacter sp. EGI 63066]
MTISIWRYSHLALAVSSFVFIVLAAVTGVILAFEPISNRIKPYKVDGLDKISLAETTQAFQEKYPEVLEMEIDANDFFIASVFTEEGDNLNGYFNPETGEFLGEKAEPSRFFQTITNFHRSLFLKGVGRFFVGLCSFLLFLIAISGAILVIKRQRGVKKFFTKIVKEDFSQYYHIVLGRLSLIPIIIITLTGTYLSLEKFDLLPKVETTHQIDFDAINESPKIDPAEFPVFKNTMLSEVKSIEFPFSPDVEDYFTLKLNSRELVVNQFTGEVLSELKSPMVTIFSDLSMEWHTGQGSILWSVILAIATVNILFFIYSGFKMTFKRTASKIKNKYKKDECDYVILVGSENGNTLIFAILFHKALLKAGKKAFITQLNNVDTFKNLEHLIVFTATYGEGEAPTNASKFLNVADQKLKQPFSYSVIGFGSLAYPNFCQFAIDVDQKLEVLGNRLMPVCKINDKSYASFIEWVASWNNNTGSAVVLPKDIKIKPKNIKLFKVLQKTNVRKNPDDTFIIKLKPKRFQKINSGDLLAVYPKNDHIERLYSIGKKGRTIQLSVKHHNNGLGSGFLNGLNPNDSLKARVVNNTAFHFPKKAPQVILIANGTGIAPFLGMIEENKKDIETYLYLGLRTEKSFDLYRDQIDSFLNNQKLNKFHLALSKEKEQLYVQHLLKKDANHIAQVMQNGGVIMICGSLSMQDDVLKTLEDICETQIQKPLDYFQKKQQLKMDCY